MPQLRLRIMPKSISFVVEIDPSTTIRELLDYLYTEINELQVQNNSASKIIETWKCLLIKDNKFLMLNEKVPIDPCELLIDTQPNMQRTEQANQQQQLNQNLQQVKVQQQTQQSNNTSQQSYQSQQSKKEEENILLKINILDGNQQRYLNITFSSNQLLENVGQAVLIFCGLNDQVAAVDLDLFGNQYNKPEKRNKTLGQLQIKTNTELIARIRWIGG